MKMELTGKTVLLTGALRGLGLAMGHALIEEGAALIACGRESMEEGREKVKDLFGSRATFARINVTEPETIERAVQKHRPSIVIGNAGLTHSNSVADMPLEEWENVLRVNLTGNFLLAHAAIPVMREQGGGVILFIGTWSQSVPLVNTAAYTSSKAGLEMLTKNIALEEAGNGIRVNNLAVGVIDAGMARAQMDREPIRAKRALKVIPMRRFGKKEEIADAVVFLTSSRASYITGATLVVDGGASLFDRSFFSSQEPVPAPSVARIPKADSRLVSVK